MKKQWLQFVFSSSWILVRRWMLWGSRDRSSFRLNKNGAVRHGAVCFNYSFPQKIDEHFLVISDDLDQPVGWKYDAKVDELQDIGLLILNWDASWIWRVMSVGYEGRCVRFGFMVRFIFVLWKRDGWWSRHAVPIQWFFAELQVQDDDKVGGVFDPRAREQILVLDNYF